MNISHLVPRFNDIVVSISDTLTVFSAIMYYTPGSAGEYTWSFRDHYSRRQQPSQYSHQVYEVQWQEYREYEYYEKYDDKSLK